MTPKGESTEGPAAAVRFLCRITFAPMADGPTSFRAMLPSAETSGLQILVHFDGREYPFERHYLFARHRGEGTPHTFANMQFSRTPPGLRVGPWPGWRGIPEFPVATVSAGGVRVPLQMMPWGDELTRRAIRGGAAFVSQPEGELICTVSDDRLTPAYADLYACSQSRAVPTAVSILPEVLRDHPRLFVTRKEIPELKRRSDGSHHLHWKRVLTLLEGPVVPWEITPESKVVPGPERLRAEDRALLAALAAMVDPSPSRVLAARDSLLGFIRETREPGYQPLEIDTQAGEILCIMSVCFDWTYAQWSEEQRNEIRDRLWSIAEICWSHLGYERRDYGQAHYLGCGLGLLAFSFLFWEDHPRSREWASHCRGVLDVVTAMLPKDGFFPHGINLWIYEYGFLLRWLELFRGCAGIDLWSSNDHWRSSSAFRGASTTADGRFGITFGDPQFRVGGDSWCHYLIASRTRSSHAQVLGDALCEGLPEGVDFRNMPPRRRVYEFLYHDPTVSTAQGEHNVAIFKDGGQVFVRGPGEHPFVFTFRAGPPLGRQRYEAGEHGGYGHADPANGSFLLHCENYFSITGPGPTYRRDTILHNTITIDGQGQIGDSTVWLPEFFPPEVLCAPAEIRTESRGVSVSSELTQAYLPHLGVRKCHRALWIDHDRDIIAGCDSILCAESRSIQWNIHVPGMPHPGDGMNAMAFDLGDRRQFLRLLILGSADLRAETGPMELVPAYPNDGTRACFLRLSVDQAEVRFVWCLLLDPRAGDPRLTADDRGHAITFPDGLRLVDRHGFLTPENSHDQGVA